MTAQALAAVWVPGVPRTQGSMKSVGRGNMVHSDALVAWRSLVRDEVRRALRVAPPYWTEESQALTFSLPTAVPYTGPVAVRCIFVRGDGQGDIDKLARAVLDALTESRVIADDVQVVTLVCDRVTTVKGRGDGAFVLVATVDRGDDASALVQGAYGAEIDGWVPR